MKLLKNKFILVLLILVLIIVLAVLILRINLFYVLYHLAYRVAYEKVNGICQLQNDRLKDVLSFPNPKEKEAMLQSEDKKRFLLWKELFLKTNKISEDYFNNHIRIESIRDGDGFFISYYYIVDWALISLGDRVANENNISNISNIREPNKGIIENIITCEKAIKIFKTKFLTPFIITTHYTGLDYNGHIILFIEAESVSRRKCSMATINLRDGSFDSFDVYNDDCSSRKRSLP